MPDSDHLTSDSRCLQVTVPASSAAGVNPCEAPSNQDDARQGYARRNGGAKVYCCYGMYADAGHDADCENAPGNAGVQGTYGSVPWPESYANVIEGIAERNTSLTDQERGHLMDLARWLRDDDATPGVNPCDGAQHD